MQYNSPVFISANNASIFHVHLVYSVANVVFLWYSVHSGFLYERLKKLSIHNGYRSAVNVLFLRTCYPYFPFHNYGPVALISFRCADDKLNIS